MYIASRLYLTLSEKFMNMAIISSVMKTCSKCGREVRDIENFCPKCGGVKFTEKTLSPQLKTCAICGGYTDYLWTCAKCGKEICRNCTKTSGYLDIVCVQCAAPVEVKPPEEKPIEVVQPVAKESSVTLFINKIKGKLGEIKDKLKSLSKKKEEAPKEVPELKEETKEEPVAEEPTETGEEPSPETSSA